MAGVGANVGGAGLQLGDGVGIFVGPVVGTDGLSVGDHVSRQPNLIWMSQ